MKKDIKILVVDDFSTMRRIIKNLLRDLGFNNVVEADDGKRDEHRDLSYAPFFLSFFLLFWG